MSITARPNVLPERVRRQARGLHSALELRLVLLCLLGLLTVELLPARSQGIRAAPATQQFEVPQETDPFKREQMQRQAQESNERFRIRVALPPAVFNSPPLPGALETSPEVAAVLKPNAFYVFLFKLLWVFVGVIVWFLIARKLAPEVVEATVTWLRSRVLFTSVPTNQLVTLLAEEKAVAEFQSALQSGGKLAGSIAVGALPDDGAFSAAMEHVQGVRRLLQEVLRQDAPAAQRKTLLEAVNSVQLLKNLARPDELRPLRQMSSALEMLLKQLTEKSSNVTSSSLRTASLGASLLEELCQHGLRADLLNDPPLRLLVVDDEMFSRYALSLSLKRGLSEPEVTESSEAALKLASQKSYDLIVLDVQMPGMDGFELCSKIHETLPNRTTPVLFVTSLRDFDARANSILCGGRDLIAKPFLTFELTVKALTLVAVERLRGRTPPMEAPVTLTQIEAPPAIFSETPKPALPDIPQMPPVIKENPLAVTPVVASNSGNQAHQPESTAAFFSKAGPQIEKLRNVVERIQKTTDPRVQQEMISDLSLKVHALMTSAEASRQHTIALTASALDALLKKLLQNVKFLSAGALQTALTAARLLQDLCASESSPDLATSPPIRALAVDDDPVALRAICNALQLTLTKPDSASDGNSAVLRAAQKRFDVIFLDVQMPGVDGFEVCARIRASDANHLTPIVFVTSHDAGLMRAAFDNCGGNDFITKPYLVSELTLTALVFAVRGRMQNRTLSQENSLQETKHEPCLVPAA